MMKFVLMQAVDLVSIEFDGAITPSEADVRVMPLTFG
jgi:hypothetical protein